MTTTFPVISLALGLWVTGAAIANTPPAPPAGAPAEKPVPKACEPVVAACSAAGFVKGDAKEGYGLWKDCIDPIMQGVPQPHKAVKPLPAVPADAVAACKQKHPDFGAGKRAPPPAK